MVSNINNKRGGKKIPKNSNKSNTRVFIQFGIAGIILVGYFVAVFVIPNRFL
jgi:cytoskeletal protein RodZ